MFPVGNVASEPAGAFNKVVKLLAFGKFYVQLSRAMIMAAMAIAPSFSHVLASYRQHQQRRAKQDQRRHQRIAEKYRKRGFPGRRRKYGPTISLAGCPETLARRTCVCILA
jgi:hypothetical protein